MAQHDYVIDNSTGANVRADINSVLQAIASNNSGSSAPSSTFATQFFADTSAGIMKLRNTSNNGYVNLFTLAGGIDVDAASNFNEDVTFTGASANIVFDKSDNALEFADDVKAKFGTGDDLELFHDGSNSRLKHVGTGNLFIQADGDTVFIRAKVNEDAVKVISDGGVELYFDDTKRFETISTGVQLTGDCLVSENIKVNDDKKIIAGNGNDIELIHDGSNSFLKHVGTGNLFLQASGDTIFIRPKENEDGVKILSDAQVELYFDDSKKLETTSSGVTVSGTVTETSDIAMKSDIQPLTNTLEKIQQITGYKYNLINSISPSVGVIAQDVEKVFPELVHGSEGKKSLQYSGLIGVLVEAVKDLSAKVAALESA